MSEIELKFDDKGLIPAIIQSSGTRKVLMMAYMNVETLRMTMETGFTHFYSRSRGTVWKKGESSGNTQTVKKILYDCDYDTLLIEVEESGPACHTGKETCFFNELGKEDKAVEKEADDADGIISRVYQVIQQRKRERPKGSYVAGLFEKGENAILKKIGEEGVEFTMACAKKDRLGAVYEAADLWFHSLVALAALDIPPEEVFKELRRRR
ncbi:MAG: bifunctional phosphoribosyl-AMP cyclohydrolase/phosphoribosyl-ATP diphosphatase HisIE [Nitrospinae bacterium]|nr:bifunctional phosphoribosyl-AMP cyclohydrolase/phosphoribosyl-ATP diphosphatase HisIE [Nitrospinota bacterium]